MLIFYYWSRYPSVSGPLNPWRHFRVGKFFEHILSIYMNSNVDVIYFVLGVDADKIKLFLLNHKKVCIVYSKIKIIN